jgi:hypothetical protein
MNSRSTGIIATIAAVILCACPGLVLCIVGVLGATGTPFNTELNGVSSSAPMPFALAVGMLCASLILMLIPVVVGFFTLRSKPASAPPVSNAPLPPTS